MSEQNNQATKPGAIKNWLISIAVNSVVVVLFIAWKFHGVEQAGNLLQFWLWSVSVLGLVFMFAPARGAVAPRLKGLRIFSNTMGVAILCALAWFGHFVLAVFYALGAFGFAVYRSQFDDEGVLITKNKESK